MEGIYEKLLQKLKIPIFIEENGKITPLSDGAKGFDPTLTEKIVIDGKTFLVLNVDISHIRGVLHDIRILLQRLEAGCSDALRELKNLVEDFLKLETPSPVLDITNACEILRNIISFYKWNSLKISCDNLLVKADIQYLYRILLNLLDNAYKYSSGNVEVMAHGHHLIIKTKGEAFSEGEGIKIVRKLMKEMDGNFEIYVKDGFIHYDLEFLGVEA